MNNKFKKILLTIFSLFMITAHLPVYLFQETTLVSAEEAVTTYVDDLGREIDIPESVESVLSTGSVSQVVLYTLIPETMIGWNSQPHEEDLQYLPTDAKELPEVGSVFGKKALNIEEIIQLAPDLIIDMGEQKGDIQEELDELQAQTDIPIIFLEAGSLKDLPALYEKLGDLLNIDTTKQQDYIQNKLDLAATHQATIQADDLSFYYAGGDDGLFTSSQDSFRTEVFDLVGLTNVFEVDEDDKPHADEVSFEQIITWQPDTVIFSDERNYTVIEEEPWKTLPAVESGRAYAAPDHPFNWLTGPKSVNAILGIAWVGQMYYPDLYDFDMIEEAQEFYQLFYHYDLSEEEAQELLQNSTALIESKE